MEAIVIQSSAHSAGVNFNPDGNLLLEGKSLPENVAIFYDPLIEFISKLAVEQVVFNINLDYFNTATSKKLFDLLKHLDANNKNEEVLINWHYEEGDEDSIEMAEIYEEECLNRTRFRYIEHPEHIMSSQRVKEEHLI